MLTDNLGRTVSYLRLSVTDRCNLRCVYCMTHDFKFIPHPRILRYEEMHRLIDIAAGLGISKLRLTGGEPFARKGFPDFVAKILTRHPELDLRITTNGTLVEPHLEKLAAIGVKRLNISLDTLDANKYKEITGFDQLDKVLRTIKSSIEAGIQVKINAVAMKGVNDSELKDFLDLATKYPIDMRFIEFMPMGEDTRWNSNVFWSAKDILEQSRSYKNLIPVAETAGNKGPARIYDIDGGKGRLGLISPVSSHFCGTCNRLRITAEGKLRTCLFSDKVYNLRGILRNPKLGDEQILEVLRRSTVNKPLGYRLLENKEKNHGVCDTQMSAIGG
ncbi:GTP 3',8-cyclase MoaA [Maridesulfovibrio bastinii]|uniref:GTP 3',8-cyclase MoaA n=1 Tax=Maridesulfovibrio bastinii TaxID=47157 RepID=UPI0004220A22|nr:GTP 3',8-cyclase MoaA [Maridesulfovibrio bastinii]